MSRKQLLVALCLTFGFPAALLWTLGGYHTRFAPNYSEKRFRELQVGQTREQALEQLGKPLRNLQAEVGEEWCYAINGTGTLLLETGTEGLTDLTAGEWCVRFGSDGLSEAEFPEDGGRLQREAVRHRLGPPAVTWPSGRSERFVYSEPAGPRVNWQWREVVIQAGTIRQLVSHPMDE